MSPSSERLVVLAKDLHARPAGEVARAAAGYAAATALTVGERRVDARSVLAVMALGAPAGTEVRVAASGPDAAAAVEEISRILAAPDA